jgi:methylenetetrahydrofolate reductase (NADPH)
MKSHIHEKIYHVEILPPRQDSEDLERDLTRFADKYNKVMESGYCVCLTDNAMGSLAFQGHETIAELELEVNPKRIMIHLNTFHTQKDLNRLLDAAQQMGIKYFLVVSGDGSTRLPKLQPSDIEAEGVAAVTSIELMRYMKKHYPDFVLGAAFNPYEPEEHEFKKLARKMETGASFIVTQPLIAQNPAVDKLLERYPNVPVIIGAWMTKKLYLLSDVVGYAIPGNAEYDPVATLEMLHRLYPTCGFYLSLLGFKTQYPILETLWK